jgi:parallel beta-helix repeat protein
MIDGGTGNTINSNDIFNNAFGIEAESPSCIINENRLYNNGIGMSIDATGCTIQGNTLNNSITYGIYAKASSNNNVVSNNSFTNLSGLFHAKEEGTNQWDNGTQGNYWDDYYGPDNDANGIGEVPYTIGGVLDQYPTGIFQELPMITNNTPTHLAEGVNKKPTLSVNITDPEGGRMDVYFYYVLENLSYLIDIAENVESGGTASVLFWSTVLGQNAVYTYFGHGYDYIGVWYVIVKDQYSENKSSEWIFSTLSVPIENEKPIADTGVPYSCQF